VNTTGKSGEVTLKWRTVTALVARMRFGSSMRRLRYCELGLPSRRKAAPKIAAPSHRSRKDGSHRMHRVTKGWTHQKCG